MHIVARLPSVLFVFKNIYSIYIYIYIYLEPPSSTNRTYIRKSPPPSPLSTQQTASKAPSTITTTTHPPIPTTHPSHSHIFLLSLQPTTSPSKPTTPSTHRENGETKPRNRNHNHRPLCRPRHRRLRHLRRPEPCLLLQSEQGRR